MLKQEKAGSDGSYPVQKVKAVSGEKLLRNIMLDSKIELYGPYVCSAHFSLLALLFSNMRPNFLGDDAVLTLLQNQ